MLLSFLGSLLVLCALIFLLVQQPAVQATGSSFDLGFTDVEIHDLVMEDSRLSFRLLVPSPEIAGNGQVTVRGLIDATSESGQPSLPYYSTLIILPPGKNPAVSVSNIRERTITATGLALNQESELAPYLELEGIPLTTKDVQRANESTTDLFESSTTFYPLDLYDVSQPMYFRDLRLVRLNIFPLRYLADSNILLSADEIEVSITFEGSNPIEHKDFKSISEPKVDLFRSQILNFEQVEDWRGLPLELEDQKERLPVGSKVFRIEVDADGIYELTAEQLAVAGMDTGPGGVDPHTFQMIYRGDPIAYEFIGNDDDSFDVGESIRFFGWAFDGSRLERQFFNENVFWLWANGAPLNITSTPSISGTTITEVPYSVTVEQENRWFSTYTNQWDLFPNEPDAWYWQLFSTSYTPVSETFQIDLEFPVTQSVSATLTAEFSSRGNVNHQVALGMNGNQSQDVSGWYGAQNVNVTRTIPAETLLNGANNATITVKSSSNNCYLCIALNRVTMNFRRKLEVSDDRIIFKDEGGGARQFDVGGFSHSQPADTVVWDISDRYQPRRLLTETLKLEGSGTYSLSFGTASPAPATFIATNVNHLLEPVLISTYEPPNLDPPLGGADWVAISHQEFITETERLASHREIDQFGSLSTHIVDIADVVNQYGFGLPVPEAIQSYMRHALQFWENAPDYLLLVGDSTIDPRHNNASWDDRQFVPTDLVFEDFWQGQIPSDHTFSLLVGDDLLPDIAVGRLPVQDESELSRIVDKIIRYEELQLFPSGWMERITFIADANDPNAGYFCDESRLTGGRLPSSFNPAFLCLDDFGGDTSLLKEAITDTINSVGTTILNYRGHGGVSVWGQNIFSVADLEHLENSSRPFFSISGDCLDTHFAFPFATGLGEELLADVDSNGYASGAVGHWGSTGLGTSLNHSVIIEAFYDALFNGGQVTVGGATMVGKVYYGTNPFTDPTLLWSFTLLGDPAMQLYRPSLSIEQSVEPSIAWPGDIITYSMKVENRGVYPSHTVVSQRLPTGFQFISATTSVSATYELVGDTVLFDLQFGEEMKDKGIPRNGMALIIMNVAITEESASGIATARTEVTGTGLEASPGDEVALVEVLVVRPMSLLPYISR